MSPVNTPSRTHIFSVDGSHFSVLFCITGPLGGKVHTIKSNCIIELVAYHSDKREVTHTQRDQAKIQEVVL